MCGIIGIAANNNVASNVINGLTRLEYRGYDSAGLAIIDNGLHLYKNKGRVQDLVESIDKPIEQIAGLVGIGHTRWATHGQVNEINAHPHQADKIAVVHNGIIENHQQLQQELQSKGYKFITQTDTETIPWLILSFINEGYDLLNAVAKATNVVEGSYAIAVVSADQPHNIIAARRNSPLVIGYGEHANYVASDPLALFELTNKVSFLNDGDIAAISKNSVQIFDEQLNEKQLEVSSIEIENSMTTKGSYKHFMLKEIFEHPQSCLNTLKHYCDFDNLTINLEALEKVDWTQLNNIKIVACGSAYYAGMVAKYWFEEIANVNVEIDVASEFRYRNRSLNKNDVVFFISQSGETADTLASLQYCKQGGIPTISIVNVEQSSIFRLTDISIHTKAGVEIGVASTKAFMAQIMTMALVSLYIMIQRKLISKQDLEIRLQELKQIPLHIETILTTIKDIKAIAENHVINKKNAMYIARGNLLPVAMEGALKLKELSYIHAEAIGAGELKHGPLALIDPNIITIACAPSNLLYEKMISNIEEVIARSGPVIMISDNQGHNQFSSPNLARIHVPCVSSFCLPFIYSIPMHLLAYYSADLMGKDVDRPRNLAKSVTVE